jgi:transcription initiation factor TFIID subunit 5
LTVNTNILRHVTNYLLQTTVTSSSSTAISPNSWEESTGLLSSLIPQNKNSTAVVTDIHSFNASNGLLKLGPAPFSDELQSAIKDQAMVDRDITTPYDVSFSLPQVVPGTTSPSILDLPPHPPTFKTVDVRREVEKVRDERKRIRLDPSVLTTPGVSPGAGAIVRAHALPSVCAYTLHDVPEGSVFHGLLVDKINIYRRRVPCCAFSPDVSLMAAGFAESYIRLWSLKGEKLKGMRSDFQPSSIKDGL